MKRTEFEDILLLDTPYYKNLEKTYRDVVTFNRYYDILKKISKGDGFIARLGQKGGKELVFLGRKIFTLQDEFVVNYIKFVSDQSLVNKWERFFERYSTQLFDIYKNFITGGSDRMLIFEIVNRKLLRDLLTKHTAKLSLEAKMGISERFGVVINQLFSYIRNSLTKNVPLTDTLILDSYEKIPFLPKGSHVDTMKLLTRYFLERGLPEPVFSSIYKSMMTAYYIETKNSVIDSITKLQTISKDNILEIFKSYLFFPDDDTLAEILSLLKKKATDMIANIQKRKGSIEKKISDTKRKIRETTNALRKQLIDVTEDFSTETSIDNMLKKLRRSLVSDGYDLKILKSECSRYTDKEKELQTITDFKTKDLLKFVCKNEWDPFIILTHISGKKVSDEQLQLLVRDSMTELKHDKRAQELMNNYKITGFLKEKYDTNSIMDRFYDISQHVIMPLMRAFLLEELIEYYPKISGVASRESVRYLAEEAMAGRVHTVEKDVNIVTGDKTVTEFAVSRFKNLISVLVYDIRGSTFMGTKLRDAQRESEIRNYFQESMLSAVEKFGGMPVKDTGDGGIVLFAENYHEIKNRETADLKPGSSLAAVRSGLEMVRQARCFVQENINKYKDWFRESEEREIHFEGATYATLPPSYQSIFQIGVGIASGTYPKEIFLDTNAYGEYDLTGMLVREANFYSKVKAKAKSTVICDDATVYNLLLNIKKFSFLSETGLRTDPLMHDIEQGLEYWIHQKAARRGFILDLYKIFVTQLGQEYTRPGSLKIMLGLFDIEIDEAGEIKDGKGGRGKYLFEINSEGIK